MDAEDGSRDGCIFWTDERGVRWWEANTDKSVGSEGGGLSSYIFGVDDGAEWIVASATRAN